jgi:hypothetical protein
MKRTRDDDVTRELTGADAAMDEAEVGDAGNGADPYGADFTGGFPRPLEEEPAEHDIGPDRIESFPGATPEDEDREITARPGEPQPFDPSELP